MFQFIEAQLDYHKKAVMTLDSILPTLRSLLGKVTSHSEDKIHSILVTYNFQFWGLCSCCLVYFLPILASPTVAIL